MRNIVSENQEREKAAKQEELNPRDSTLMVSGGHAALHRCSAPHRITAQRRQAEKAVVLLASAQYPLSSPKSFLRH